MNCQVKLLAKEYNVFELWVKQPHRLCWELKCIGPGPDMLEQGNKYLLGEV